MMKMKKVLHWIEELLPFIHTPWILPRLNKKRNFWDPSFWIEKNNIEKAFPSRLKNRAFDLNGAKFRGYDENEKGPPLDRGPFSFSSYPLNFALIKSEMRFPRRDGNARQEFITEIWPFYFFKGQHQKWLNWSFKGPYFLKMLFLIRTKTY